jgi:hypothetical protein
MGQMSLFSITEVELSPNLGDGKNIKWKGLGVDEVGIDASSGGTV